MEFSKSYLRYRNTTTNTSSLATVLIAVVTINWNLTCSTVTIARDYWLSVLIILCTTSTEAFFLNDPYQRSIMIHPKGTTFTAAAKVFREKAKTFGQSAEEIQKVNYYLRKIQNLEAKQHPEETIQRISASLSARASEAVAVEVAKFEKRLKDSTSVNPEENGRYFEGDIILDVTQARDIYESMLQHGRRIKRKFIRSELRRWDSRKPIFYSFDGSHTTREQRVIELALEHWHNITCLNFERRDDEIQGNRIVFTDVDGCASNVGRHPLGEPQFVSLAPECIRLGVIAHEVAHALGFWHEQSRPDRDNYVTVRWENIDRDSKGQFLKELPTEVDNGGVPYDYGSIMHYRSKAFGRYEDLFTLNTNIADYQKTIGQRDQLSFNDIRLMNIIYCKNSCIQQLPCQRGGYTDPRRCDRCRCPDGFTGKLCDQVMPGFGADCGGRMELTSSWKRITSPNYPNEFKEGQECSWLLVAPLGQRVQLRFYGEFEMYCKVRHSLCMDYIEIRNSTDFANTGMRYCCFGTPQSLIMSATEDMLVLFRSFYRGGKGFQAQVRALPTTGLFSAWSQWSACSASCGACGIRHRRRTCVGGACFVEESNSEVCGRTACSGLCAYKIFEKTRCGGFLALFNNMKCRRERTVLEPCKIYCYPGYIAHKWTLFMIHKYAYVINNSTNTHR